MKPLQCREIRYNSMRWLEERLWRLRLESLNIKVGEFRFESSDVRLLILSIKSVICSRGVVLFK
jgi:hypothetical protein